MSFWRSVLISIAEFMVRVVICLPNMLLSFLAKLLARCYGLMAAKELNQLFKNIDKVLGLPRHSFFAKSFANQVVYFQFLNAFESLKVIFGGQKVIIDGLGDYREVLSRAIAMDRGLVITTAHIGSWELLSKYTAELLSDRRLVVLAKPARQLWVTALLERLRGRSKVDVLWQGSKSLTRDMLQTLKYDKNALGFVMDQKPKGRVGTAVEFYGHHAEFVRGPAQIATKTGAPVISAFCVRIAPMHYKVVFFDTVTESSNFPEEELTKVMAQNIEDMIKMYPEQWCWNYKRWKFPA